MENRASSVCLLLLATLLACGKTQIDFRKDLSELGVDYTQTEFLKRITDGDVIVVRLFLESGMSPNAISDGQIPLVVGADQPDMVEILLEHGADPNSENEHELTPLGEAANKGNLKTAKMLVQAGAEINPSFKNGWTPLLRSVAYGNSVDVALFLYNSGADVNARTPWGNTAYGEALYNKNQELARLLEGMGAKEVYTEVQKERKSSR